MTTDRKIFIFITRRGIMEEIEYPGVAQLVGRDIWDVEVGCSSHLTRTKIPLKSTISEGFFLFFVYCDTDVELVILNISSTDNVASCFSKTWQAIRGRV